MAFIGKHKLATLTSNGNSTCMSHRQKQCLTHAVQHGTCMRRAGGITPRWPEHACGITRAQYVAHCPTMPRANHPNHARRPTTWLAKLQLKQHPMRHHQQLQHPRRSAECCTNCKSTKAGYYHQRTACAGRRVCQAQHNSTQRCTRHRHAGALRMAHRHHEAG